MSKSHALLVLLLTAPVAVHAQPPRDLKGLFGLLVELINGLIVVAVALALLFFVWGLAKFILNAGSEDARKEGRQIMIWGTIALFVMVSIWGIIAILDRTFIGGSGAGGGSGNPPAFSEPTIGI